MSPPPQLVDVVIEWPLRKAADGIVPPREAVNGRATAYEQSFLQIDVEEKFQVH